MESKLTRLIFAILLGLIGLVFVVFYSKTMKGASGNEIAVIEFYLAKDFTIAALIGGLGMIVVSVFIILTNHKNLGCGHDHGDEDHDHADHEHSELSPMVALLVICLPVGIAVANTQHKPSLELKDKLSSSEMTAETFQESGFEIPPYTIETLDSYKSKNEKGAYIMGVREMFAVAGDPEVSEVLEGIEIEVEGSVRSVPSDPKNPKIKRMYRMFMTCCAADMQAIPLRLELSEELTESFSYDEHSWLKVHGSVTFSTDKEGIKRTVIKVHTAEATTAPDNEILQFGRSSVIQDKL